MEDYRLEQSGQEVQDILNGAAMQTDLTAENERAELAEQTLQGNIDAEALARENADGVLQGHIDDEETRAKAAEKQNADDIDAIEEKIPTQASSSNQLADKDYVEDLVSTSSATFRGTFNLVSDLHLTVDASYADIAAALGNAIAGADNNDFAFVMIPTSVDTPNEIASIEKYKFNGSVWGFEYMLNNSGFTAAQWAAINSGITSALVTKLGALPSAADLAAALLAKQDKLTFDQAPTPSSTNPVTSGGVYTAIDDEKGARVNADALIQQAIEAILALIPSAATALNQLADKAFVNSSIATATATFRGTFNLVSDLQLTVDATHADIAVALLNAIAGADNNDYAFVQIPTSVDTPTEIRVTERYKFDGTAWQYEYDLNNSGFTAAQWAAINSGITTLLVTKLSNLPNATELATLFAGKQNVLTFDDAPVSGSDNPVKSGGLYDLFAAIDAKMPTGASANNKLVAEDRLAAYVGGIIGAIDATFNLTSTDGHVTLRMTQTDGVITSLQILTSDIASASALATLGGQVSTNADDIAALQALYNALQQSAPQVIEPTDTWPVASPSDTVIYRVIDRVNTPPQYYSDYMWNGTAMVLMATYNNAIDPRPKKASQNLVTSGGVFDNMGALDVSELNATENPHALAQYVDLSAALAAVPIDYQKGGMSIKFVQSSDNMYVRYRLTSKEWSTEQSDWINENLVNAEISNIDADLDVTDKNYNVLARFKNGHVRTEKFDSEDIVQKVSDNTAAINIRPYISESNYDNIDFVDPNGNVGARIPLGFDGKPHLDSPYVIVDVNGNGKYTSITQASANEPADTVFLIMPGVYEDEVVDCKTKRQYFIGADREHVIVRNYRGDYDYPPFNIAAGLLKNMTIIAAAEEGVDVSIRSTDTIANRGVYAVHSDWHTASNDEFTIDNCTLISDWYASWGIGLRGGCHMYGRNSRFISNYGYGMLCHDNDWNIAQYDGEQYLHIIDCVIHATDGVYPALMLNSRARNDETWVRNSIFYIEMIKTLLKSEGNADTYQISNGFPVIITPDDFLGLKNGRLLDTSWGNSETDFNA